MAGRVVFVGCGPGSPDLLTLRAAAAIASADVIVWSERLLMRAAVDAHAKPGAEIITWPPATMEDVERAYDRARDEGIVVARLKGGDATLFGRMERELEAVRSRGVEYGIVPGVSALTAAAAAAGIELTPERRLEIATPSELANDPPVVAVFIPGDDPQAVVAALRARGLADSAECTIAHRISWPGELIATVPLHALAEELEDLNLGGMTLILAR